MRVRRAARSLTALALAMAIVPCSSGCSLLGSPGGGGAPDPIGTLKHTPVGDVEPVVAEWGVAAPNRIMVMLAEEADPGVAAEVAEALGGEVVGEIGYLGVYTIGIPPTDAAGLERAAAAAEKVEGVELATPDLMATVQARVEGVPCSVIKDNPVYAGENGRPYEMIGAERAWKVVRASGLQSNSVTVGVTDGGLYRGQGELDGDVQVQSSDPGNDDIDAPEVGEDGKPRPYGSHAAGIVGIVGADPDNGGQVGIASPLGKGLKMLHTRVLGGRYGGASKVATDPDDPTQAIWLEGALQDGALVALLDQVKKGATVINCSWGVKDPTSTDFNRKMAGIYKRFFERMQRDYPKVVFVCAAGNDGYRPDHYWPGGQWLDNVITVGNLNNDGSMVASSNTRGRFNEVTIGAPGDRVVSGVGPDGTVANTHGGTSFAAAQVTAAIALMQSLNPELSATRCKEILEETMTKEFKDPKTGAVTKVTLDAGGGCLAVDAAVLKVVNGVRKAADGNAKDLTFDDIEALYGVTLSASSANGGDWDVVASVGGAGPKGTDLTIKLDGPGAIGGTKAQHAGSGGKGSWSVSSLDGPVLAHVTRSDTGACSRVEIGQDPWVGTWGWTAWYGFKYRMTVARSGGGYAGKTNGATGSTVRIEGDRITVSSSFRDMFGENTETWTGQLKDGAIVGTFEASGSSGTRKESWRATKVE